MTKKTKNHYSNLNYILKETLIDQHFNAFSLRVYTDILLLFPFSFFRYTYMFYSESVQDML